MTDTALVYVAERFFYRLIEFFRHWYVKSGRLYSNFVLNQLEKLDYYLAWKITARHLFQPLYKDYSVIGYAMGFSLRLIRLTVASAVYMVVICFAIAVYILWLLLPIYLIFKAIAPLV
ncbi:MAG: hypothetical protein V1696_00075 [Candidatus Jorgensenbacteria bacterium]